MSQALIGFIGGIGVSLIGALAASLLERRTQKRREVDEARFEVFMTLLNINSLYFWITTAEFHREKAPDEIRRQIRSLSWQVLDRLRETDQVERLDEIVHVLLSEDYETARERSEAMNTLIEDLGSMVNPRYTKAIRRVSRENQKRLLQDLSRSNSAPGATTPL